MKHGELWRNKYMIDVDFLVISANPNIEGFWVLRRNKKWLARKSDTLDRERIYPDDWTIVSI